MTKRTKQHRIEDLSRYKFGLSIPQEWVFRDKDKDYGIDGEVEIFDEKEKASGLLFYVQLKATSSKNEKEFKTLDLSIDRIRYYKSLDLPVLITRYAEHADVFYVKWATELDLFFAKKDAKTYRVVFNDSDILDASKIEYINMYLKKLRFIKQGFIAFPLKIHLSIESNDICGMSSGLLMHQLRRNIDDYKGIITLETNHEKYSANVSLTNSMLKVGFLDVAGCTLHGVSLMNTESLASDLVKDICLALALSLAQLGYCDLAARIVFSNSLSIRLKHKSELLEHLLPSLLKSNYFKETLDVVNDACEDSYNNILEVKATTILLLNGFNSDSDKAEAVEVFLMNVASRCKRRNAGNYGSTLYNLGNFYRSTNRIKKSIEYYLKARRFEPIYYNQAYFFQELGGLMFDYGKYGFSVIFYRKALEIEQREEWVPLYADAMMFAGNYKDAHELFENYLKGKSSVAEVWLLKDFHLAALIDNKKIEKQVRNVKKAIELADVTHIDFDKVEEQLDRALNCDLLCGLAWYNLAHCKVQKNEYDDAGFCFTMCALSQNWDVEAWVKATICYLTAKSHISLLIIIIKNAYSSIGEEYLSKLYEGIELQLNGKLIPEIFSFVEEIIKEHKNKDNTPKLRVLNEKGKFEDILKMNMKK